MTEVITNPNGMRKLEDDELVGVAGRCFKQSGFWNEPEKVDLYDYRQEAQKCGVATDFDRCWDRQTNAVDQRVRAACLATGQPWRMCYCHTNWFALAKTIWYEGW